MSGGIAFGGFFAQTGVTTGSNFDTRNVFVFNSTPLSIEAAAAAIAADVSVNANGTETLVATLIGTDIATLDGNFLM